MKDFIAYVISQQTDGTYIGELKPCCTKPLEKGELLIKVAYSSLNYKDVLSATGNKGVTKVYPHIPGIDADGTVIKSNDDHFQKDDHIVITGFDFGMNHDGGFAEYIQVPAEWVTKLPPGMRLREAMCYGTAGLTAAHCIEKLTSQLHPNDGPLIVSGATGGVGSLSIAMLAKLGFEVIAITGKKEAESYLIRLGAKSINMREDWNKKEEAPLLKSSIAGGIDCVGGEILTNIIKSTHLYGAIACCGMIASTDLSLSVFPFILRGITLYGISSQHLPQEWRERLWEKIHTLYALPNIDSFITEISLKELPEAIEKMKHGDHMGRFLVKIAS